MVVVLFFPPVISQFYFPWFSLHTLFNRIDEPPPPTSPLAVQGREWREVCLALTPSVTLPTLTFYLTRNTWTRNGQLSTLPTLVNYCITYVMSIKNMQAFVFVFVDKITLENYFNLSIAFPWQACGWVHRDWFEVWESSVRNSSTETRAAWGPGTIWPSRTDKPTAASGPTGQP